MRRHGAYNGEFSFLILALDIKSQLTDLIRAACAAVSPQASELSIVLERPKNAQHGDYACNVAMQAAKQLKRNPRELAQAIVAALPASCLIGKAEIAGAGFINFFIGIGAKQAVVREVLAAGVRYGETDRGRGQKISLEFVSSNPTGPLHVAHGRAAAFGASLANVMAAAGFVVQREYYVNDAGRQMDILTASTWLRYLQLAGADVPYPPNAYQGDYVQAMAQEILAQYGARMARTVTAVMTNVPALKEDACEKDRETARDARIDALIANAKQLLGGDFRLIHAHALKVQVDDMRADLTEFGVDYDCWYSEQSLYDNGLLDQALGKLIAAGHTYEEDGALWFRATQFGDEKDRVLRRSNGQYTYFAPDIAYHASKYDRGAEVVIDLWGPDHHGYIPRVRAAIAALGRDPEKFIVIISQLVKLYREGQPVKLSTRAGNYVTLRDLRTEVGRDAARFFYILRKSDQQLDFDLDLAKSQSNDNPVYYIQYAHARISSVFERWGGDRALLQDAKLDALTNEREAQLLQTLLDYPEVIANAALDYAPHALAYYLKDLAGHLHSYYNAEQFLVDDDALKLARLALIAAVQQVLRNGLVLLGVSAPERM